MWIMTRSTEHCLAFFLKNMSQEGIHEQLGEGSMCLLLLYFWIHCFFPQLNTFMSLAPPSHAHTLAPTDNIHLNPHAMHVKHVTHTHMILEQDYSRVPII